MNDTLLVVIFAALSFVLGWIGGRESERQNK